MATNLNRVTAAFNGRPWAIEHSKLLEITAMLERRLAGAPKLTAAEMAAIRENRARPVSTQRGAVAVIPMYGVLAQRLGMMEEISGGTSTEALAAAVKAAADDPNISAIVLDVESPGGSVDGGLVALTEAIEAAAKVKRVVAVATGTMASAAYWAGSAASEIVAAPFSAVGSIGVYATHIDRSGADEQAGIKTTLVSAGRYKTDGNPHEPLSDSAREHLQAMADEAYGEFVRAVARHRGVGEDAVRNGYGEGRALMPKQALAAGLIDRVGTLDDVVAELTGGSKPVRRMAAELDEQQIAALAAIDRIVVPAGALDVTPDADGAAPMVEVIPAHTPAPEARSEAMSDGKVTAAPDTGAARVQALYELAAEYEMPVARAKAWVDGNVSVEAAQKEILADQRARTKQVVTGSDVRAGEDRRAKDPRKGFESHRDFLLATIQNSGLRDRAQVADERLRILAVSDGEDRAARGELAFMLPEAFTPASLRAAAGSDEQGAYDYRYGGAAVPSSILPGVLSVGPEADPTAGRTVSIPMATPTVSILARTDKNHQTSVAGGLTVTRRPETVAASPSRMEMERVELKAATLTLLAYESEELLTDSAVSFAAMIAAGGRDQFAHKILSEKIRGVGGGEYLGVLNSPAKVAVAKESGQAADTLLALNILKMRARVWNYSDAIWLANHDTYVQLAQAAIVKEGTAGGGLITVFQPSLVADRPDMLLGRPIFFTEYASTLGDEGDLMCVNFSQYLEGMYQPLQSAESVHVRFVEHERVFKMWTRNAGAPWWRSALTPHKGADSLSPIVTLAARA